MAKIESKRKRENKQLVIILLAILAAVVFTVVILIGTVKNAKRPAFDDARSLVKEQKVEEAEPEKKSEDTEDIKNMKTAQSVSSNPSDPFYPLIIAQLERQRYLGENDVKNNYSPRDNYIRNAADSNGEVHVFKKKAILIYVPEGEYYDPITQAFVAYNNQFKGLFEFRGTKNPKKSDIKIIVTDNISDFSDIKGVVGLGTQKKYDKDGNIEYSELMLLSKSLDGKSNRSKIEVYNTALHEIGHCIGISGHSQNPNDVMYKSVNQKEKTELNTFSQRDIETIKLMYSGRKDLIAQSLENVKEEKLQENLKYAQEINNSDSYIKIADSYYNMGQYGAALEAYKKALSLNPENYRIYMSLTNCYQKAKQYANAVTYGKYALEKAKTDEQKTKASINIAYALTAQKDYEEALIYYKKAMELNPKEKIYLFSYLVNCERLNRKAEAKETYEEYGKNYSEDEFSEDEKVIIDWVKS